MEQKRSYSREKKRGGYAETGQSRHKNRRAEHGEHVLNAQYQHLRRAQLTRVKNALLRRILIRFFTVHNLFLLK